MAAKITIRDKNDVVIVDAFDYVYNGTLMGDRKVSVEVKSAVKIDFAVGDYIEFGEYETEPARTVERFHLQTIPVGNRIHNSLMVSYSLIFWWRGYELKTINFLDYIEGEVLDHQYNRNTGEVAVFGTIVQLMDRIKANMGRSYTWTYLLGTNVDHAESKQITLQNVKCWDALLLVSSLFGYDFRIEYDTRVISVGTFVNIPAVSSHTFEFGKGDGLAEITRLHSDVSLVTRVYAYGSSRNIPPKYRTEQFEHGYAPRLMLPEAEYPDGYISDPALEATYGVREDYFINEEIYPSIVDGTIDAVLPILDAALPDESITSVGIRDIRVPRRSSRYYRDRTDPEGSEVYGIDTDSRDDVVIRTSRARTDSELDGNGTNYNEVTVFIVTDLDINDENIKSTLAAKMSFTTGYLQGVELQINSWTPEFVNGVVTGRVKVVLQRSTNDENYQLPNETVTINAGDVFVLLDIFLPESYVTAAEDRLALSAIDYLASTSSKPLAYSVSVPEEFIARTAGIISYLREGAALPVLDTILDIDENYLVQSVSIDYKSEKYLPTFNLTLADKPLVGRIEEIEIGLRASVQDSGAAAITIEQTIINTNSRSRTFRQSITNDYGYLKGGQIEPQSILNSSLSIDLRSGEYLLQAYLRINYEGDVNSVYGSDGYLIHKDIDVVWGDVYDINHQTWTIAAPQTFTLDPAKYYWAYIQCDITDGSAEWYISENKIPVNGIEGYYLFEWGQIMPVVNGTRITQQSYGAPAINPDLIAPAPSDDLFKGGRITWIENYDYSVVAAKYYLSNVSYPAISTDITLVAADPTYDRIDLIVVNDSGEVEVITGVPALNPLRPSIDPSTQIELTFITVTANTTEPVGYDTELVYDENTEWAVTNSPTLSVDQASTDEAYTGTKSVKIFDNSAIAGEVNWTSPGEVEVITYEFISIHLKTADTSVLGQKVWCHFQRAGNRVTDMVQIDFGAGVSWKTGIVKLTEFRFTDTIFDSFHMLFFNSTPFIPIYVDTISLQRSTRQPVSGSEPAPIPTPVYNEVPSGVVNGVNKVFTLPNAPVIGSLRLYWQGQRLTPTDDYTIVDNIITFTNAPFTGSKLLADYEF